MKSSSTTAILVGVAAILALATAMAAVLMKLPAPAPESDRITPEVAADETTADITFDIPPLHVPEVDKDLEEYEQTTRAWFKENLAEIDASMLPSEPYLEVNTIIWDKHYVGGRFFSYAFHTAYYLGGAHPNTTVETRIYGLDPMRRMMWEDIFKSDEIALPMISELAYREVMEVTEQQDSAEEDEWVRTGTAPKRENFDSFALTNDGMLWYFDPYQVAPYVAGPVEITIPYEDLKSALRDDFFDLYVPPSLQ